MLKKYYPFEYIESVFHIDYQKLYDKGYRGLIFDIDNTLAHHGEAPSSEVDRLFIYFKKMGFTTVLLSNNDEERIQRFLKNIDSMYIPDANKPAPDSFLKAVKMTGFNKERTIYIGDQIFIDTYGANMCGLDNILVKYMRYPNEKKIGIRRRLEKIILWFYRHNKSYRNRLGNISLKEALNVNE